MSEPEYIHTRAGRDADGVERQWRFHFRRLNAVELCELLEADELEGIERLKRQVRMYELLVSRVWCDGEPHEDMPPVDVVRGLMSAHPMFRGDDEG